MNRGPVLALRVDDVDLVRDRALVERFQMGDPAAFATLYRRYFDRLVRYCQKRVGDPLEAEEIAQEAFARALRAMPTFAGERRFYPWLTVIAGRLCVDSHRRRGRSQPSDAIDLGATDGGQDKIVEAVDVEVLATALDRLATRHREVLDLREHQGWSYQQIADEYGVTLGTVEALLFRARKALKREFLAVVGDEPRWVALPVLGAVGRRLVGWKARFEAGLATLPPLAGPVVAGVVAVSVISGMVGLGMVAPGGRSGRQPAGVHLDSARVVATSESFAVPDPTGSGAGGGVAAGQPGAGAGAGVAVPRADTPVVDSVGADRAAQPQPVQEGIAGIVVGADPDAVVADTVNRVDGYVDQL